ncbi:MAG TPA: gluconokinase [Terriglobales bacterium]|jgi:gluconokinase|nr:gluconokinase [Terriglobales bacterium]
MVILVMGVSGSGKTTIGQLLSAQMNWPFLDGDSLHSAANVAKMAAGIPLTDEDRRPWLESLHEVIQGWITQHKNGIIASSALKKTYRQILVTGPDVKVVYLHGSYELIYQRMQHRPGHYMKADMLQSQFAALEEPVNAIVVDITPPADQIVAEIRRRLAI